MLGSFSSVLELWITFNILILLDCIMFFPLNILFSVCSRCISTFNWSSFSWNSINTLSVVKGNPNFQDILNRILQILLHYYCRKQYKNIKNSGNIEQNLVLSFPFSLFTATWGSCRFPPRQNFFISWTKYFVNFKCHKGSLVLCIVSFSGLKMIFSKFSQVVITACIKHCVYNKFNLHCYFMSSIIERLQISLL